MSTIAIYASQAVKMPDLLSETRASVENYKTELMSLKAKILTIDPSVCNDERKNEGWLSNKFVVDLDYEINRASENSINDGGNSDFSVQLQVYNTLRDYQMAHPEYYGKYSK